ncbi:hypothetical protein LguiB_008635 [Lonicera macranthoides]
MAIVIYVSIRKIKLNESDSNDSNEDNSDDEIGAKNEKSVLNNKSHFDSNKDEEGSSKSVTCGKLDRDLSAGGSNGRGSEEDNETLVNGRLDSPKIRKGPTLIGGGDDPIGPQLKINKEIMVHSKEFGDVEEMAGEPNSVSHVEEGNSSKGEINSNIDNKPLCVEETSYVNTNDVEEVKPLNFDEFIYATVTKVIKTELQARGIKCRGTLQKRAARIFLLKTKLSKKLFANK